MLVKLGGVAYYSNFDATSWRIARRSNENSGEASFEFFGVRPAVGEALQVWLGTTGSEPLFAGTIVTTDVVYNRLSNRTVWLTRAMDWSFLLGREVVSGRWTAASASTIATAVIDDFTSGFTTTHVQAGLETVDEFIVTPGEAATVMAVLTRLANRIGATFYFDGDKDLHFFVGADPASGSSPKPIDATETHYRKFRYSKDLSNIRTRALVEGGGSVASTDVAAGSMSIPVDDAVWYASGGGELVVNEQRLSYTGKVAGGTALATVTGPSGGGSVPSAPSLATINVGAGNLVGGSFLACVVFLQNGYRGPRGTTYSIGVGIPGDPPTYDFSWSSIPTGPAGTSARLLFRTPDSLSTSTVDDLRYLTTITDNTTTTYSPDTTTNANLSDDPCAPYGNAPHPAGSTVLRVDDLSTFAADGGWINVAGQLVQYTGRAASSGAGNLTGIPASGAGAIGADIPAGSPVVSAGHLLGIPAAFGGSIATDFAAGDEINVLVTRNDTTAQAALAALEGGDGVHEVYIRDRRISIETCEARGDAELALFANPIESVKYSTWDTRAMPGQDVTVDMDAAWAISGTFRIADTEISMRAGDPRPELTVQTTSQRRTLYELLRSFQRRETS